MTFGPVGKGHGAAAEDAERQTRPPSASVSCLADWTRDVRRNRGVRGLLIRDEHGAVVNRLKLSK